MWNAFQARLSLAIKRCSSTCPKRNISKTLYPRHIAKLVAKKRRLWRNYKSTGDKAIKLLYQSFSKQLSKKLNDLEIARERRVISEGNLSALFRHFKRNTKAGRDIPPLLKDGVLQVDDRVRASLFC